MCEDHNVTPEFFHKIFSTRGVSTKLIRVLTTDTATKVDVDELMSFIMSATRGSQINLETTERLKMLFEEHISEHQHEINLEEFRKIVPCKDQFFVTRIFKLFDKDRSGYITLGKFIETVAQFSVVDDDTKIEFLFNIYDINEDGNLEEGNFREVIKACMRENGMDFDEDELNNLASALFQDGVKEGQDSMDLDDFKVTYNCKLYRRQPQPLIILFQEQLQRHGLVDGLGIMINKWLVPPAPPKKKTLVERLQDKLPQRYMFDIRHPLD